MMTISLHQETFLACQQKYAFYATWRESYYDQCQLSLQQHELRLTSFTLLPPAMLHQYNFGMVNFLLAFNCIGVALLTSNVTTK